MVLFSEFQRYEVIQQKLEVYYKSFTKDLFLKISNSM